MREMKDSGVEWIGEIPKEWEVIPMRRIGNFSASGIDKLIKDNEELVRIVNYVDVYRNSNLILNNKEYMTVSASKEKIKKNLICEGDLIFTPSSETVEDIGLSALVNENIPNTSFSYHVLRFVFKRDVNKSYKKYLCNNHYVQNCFSSKATGTIRKTLSRADFNDQVVFLPPLTTQQKIADYLDRKCSKIDEIITKQGQVIEKLKAYKLSIITESVTKGLNPNVKMKDSGVEWIGEIPEHWEVCKFKTVYSYSKGLPITKA
ncbi:MAG TPA: restriction endonuclease subunit S, partial [Clostridiales bacterium]|nr:restriction endonuclease subunit S [Clostridiales bacterium]